MQRDARAYKVTEELGEWASREPVAKRVKHEFGATVSVLLPPSQFVVDCQGDSLAENLTIIARVPCEADEVASSLQAQSHVEIFRNRVLSPELLAAVQGTVIAEELLCFPS